MAPDRDPELALLEAALVWSTSSGGQRRDPANRLTPSFIAWGIGDGAQ